jgi:hypothetical protein
MAQRPDFYLLTIGRYSGKKNGKNRDNKNSPPYVTSFFLVHRPNKKKLIVGKCSLGLPLLESKSISFDSIIGRDMNDLVRYRMKNLKKSGKKR